MKTLFTLIIVSVALATGVQAQDETINETPLSLEAVENGTVVTLTNNNSAVVKFALRTYVSPTEYYDDVWYTVQNTNTINLNAGDILVLRSTCKDYGNNFKIHASKDVYVYGNPLSLIAQTEYKTMTDLSDCADGVLQGLFDKGWNGNPCIKNHPTKDIVLPATTLKNSCYYGMFKGCTSLTRAPQLPATTMAFRCYSHMFSYCTSLTAAPELPATTLADECYYAMFEGCKALTDAPALPAMTLTYACYDNMLRGCTSMTQAPELPATSLAIDCYYGMFWECTSLENAPALPATTLAPNCYNNMFYMCSSLVNAPELPATTLSENCYASMFYGCSSLEKAPVLPAPTLVKSCYSYMFTNCTKLNYVKCLATDLSANDAANDWERGTNEWLFGVAATGTFVKADGVDTWTTGDSGIPTGWTTEEASTGIGSIDNGRQTTDNRWYTLDGRMLQGEPMQKGVYIYNGKKVKK